MSEFEDEIARHRRAERKRRQEVLFQKISGYKMALFTVGEAYALMRFFDLAEPSDADLMEATRIIERHIAEIKDLWDHFPLGRPKDDPPSRT